LPYNGIVWEDTQFEIRGLSINVPCHVSPVNPSVRQSVSFYWATLPFWKEFFLLQMVLENTRLEFMLQNILTLPFCSEFEILFSTVHMGSGLVYVK